MSAHTKMRLTNTESNDSSILYVIQNHKTYAIPKKIAEKYVIDTKASKGSIPSDVVFAKLVKKLTKAGALLKGLRLREGLTQVAFAQKINVTQASLSNMENGRRPIGKNVAKRIEKAFGPNYRYFLE